jgi:hypothetical protein
MRNLNGPTAGLAPAACGGSFERLARRMLFESPEKGV